jgi:hypothetical protein
MRQPVGAGRCSLSRGFALFAGGGSEFGGRAVSSLFYLRTVSLPVGWRCCGGAGALYDAVFLPAPRSA